MKITVFVLSIVLLASVLFSVSVFSSDSTENKTVETFEECSLERSCTRSNAPASREVSFDGSFSKKVAYDSTRNYTIDKQLDVYLDNDGTLYMFNDKSEITMSQISDVKVSKVLAAIKKGYVEKPTEDEIVDISYKYAVSLFGDRTDGFSFSSVTFYEDMYNYTVVFAKNYGKDGFVTGETIICEVFEDGTVYSCAMNNAYDLSAFNDDTVKNVTEENIKQYVGNQARALYGDSFEYVDVKAVNAANIRGKACLEVSVTVDYTVQGANSKDYSAQKTEEMFYELEE